MGSGTTTPVPTSTPQPSGRSRLHNSDPTSYRQHIQEGNVQNSFIGVVGQVELQTSSRAQPEPKDTNTCDTTGFYPGEVPFKNQGTSTSPIITEITMNLSQQQTMGKGGKKKGSQKDQVNTQLWPSTSNDGTSTTSVFPPRNTGTGRPHIQCSACGGDDHFRKDCQQDNFLLKRFILTTWMC